MSDVEYSRGGPSSSSTSSTAMARTGSGASARHNVNGNSNGADASGESSAVPIWERSPEPDEDLRMDQEPTAWLVKVPRFLYEGWSALSEDDLNLGTVRVYDADHKGRQRIELILPSAPNAPIPLPQYDPNVSGRNAKRIPRQYEVKLSAEPQETLKRNIFAFKEKQERVGGKKRRNADGEEVDDDDEEDEDADLDEDDDEVMSAAGGAGSTRGSRAATPSNTTNHRYPSRKKTKISTAFAAKITNEAAVKPILSSISASDDSAAASRGVSPASIAAAAAASDSKPGTLSSGSSSKITPEYREILRRRKMEATKPQRTVKMLDEGDQGANNMLAAGLGSGGLLRGKTSSFVVGTSTNKSGGGGGSGSSSSSSNKEKFARIPKSDLLDLIFSCYERYTYWTLRALREETRQPESYLRETLSSIADLHKRGPYVGQWSLKKEYVQERKAEEQRNQSAIAGQQQQALNGQGGGADDEDDEMEEVA